MSEATDPRGEQPTFSVIIPTHNRPAFLETAIASVVDQSIEEWELIVVDDAGTIPARIPLNPRVRLIRQEIPTGPAGARNTGLAHASGRYVAFLDDDDLWRPRRLENALRAHEYADLAICGEMALGEPDPVTDEISIHLTKDPHDWVLNSTAPNLGRVSVIRELCLPFDLNYVASQDLDWWLRCSGGLRVAAMYRNEDWVWRRHDEVRTRNGNDRRIEGSLRLLSEHASYFEQHPIAHAFRWRRLGLMYLDEGDHGAAIHAGFRSLRVRPSVGAMRVLAKAATPFRRASTQAVSSRQSA